MLKSISSDEVAAHSTVGDLWVVADGYVVDISAFASDHPGGIDNILSLKESGSNFSFSSHFRYTTKCFNEACIKCEQQKCPITLTFQRSRKNGGLDRNGNITSKPNAAVGSVTILGKQAT